MQMTDSLAQMGGFESVARDLGMSPSAVAAGAEALLPAILGGFEKQVQSSPVGGLEGLSGLLAQLGGGSLLDRVLSPQPTDVGQGNDVLRQIFGSKDVSRSVAQSASAQTGMDAGLLKKMLPMLAMLVAGYLAKQGHAAPAQESQNGLGGLGGLLGGLLGGGAGAGVGSAAGGLGAMLDMNGDGNALDDILRLAAKAMR